MTPGVLIPCAAHVPPRCRGKTKNVCESHAGLRAGITHCIRNPSPKLFPEQPKTWFGGTHSPLKSNLGAPWRTQMRPRGAQERPRGAQKTPRSARETPKSSREPTKSIQKAAKMRPRCSRPPQNLPWYAPRCILGAFFAGTCVRKARGSDFRWIFVHRVKAQALIFTAPASVL